MQLREKGPALLWYFWLLEKSLIDFTQIILS